MTEFEVLRRLETIRGSTAGPMVKVRMLVQLHRTLGKQVASLKRVRTRLRPEADPRTAAALARLASQTERLDEEIRDAAFQVLHPDRYN